MAQILAVLLQRVSELEKRLSTLEAGGALLSLNSIYLPTEQLSCGLCSDNVVRC